MPDITTTVDIHIDLDKGLQSQPLRMMLAAGNAQAHQLRLHALRDGTPIDLSGTSVSGFCLRADGSTVPLEGKIENGAAVLLLSAACYAVPGTARISMTLIYGETIATHVLATAMVDAISSEIIVDPEHVIPSLAELLGQIAAMEQATEAAVGAAEFANASGEQAYLLAQQATVNLTTQVNERLRRIAPPIINTAAGDGVIILTDSSENSFERLSIFGRTTQEGTPSPDNPAELVNIGTKGNIGLMVRGKNLLDESKCQFYDATTNKFAPLVNLHQSIVFAPGVDYVLSFDTSNSGVQAYVNEQFSGNGVYFVMDGTRKSIKLNYPDGRITPASTAFISRASDTSDATTGTIRNIMIEVGSTATVYAPYTDSGSMTLIPPAEIFGIPVSGGGNYTDETGQQWLCDEIDLAKGVFVKNVPFINLAFRSYNETGTAGVFTTKLTHAAIPTGYTDDQTDVLLCNTLPPLPRSQCVAGVQGVSLSSTHMYVCVPGCTTTDELLAWFEDNQTFAMYRPAKPINQETVLSDDIMSAAMALKSLYPNTTIINDEGAGMAAAYVADTKLYIDNKFAALAAASIDQ